MTDTRRQRARGVVRSWMSAALLAALGCGGVAACGTREEPPAEPPPAPVEPPAAPAPSAPPAEELPSAEALPVPDDFEHEAAAEITEASYRAQLDVIEKELEAELAAGRE